MDCPGKAPFFLRWSIRDLFWLPVYVAVAVVVLRRCETLLSVLTTGLALSVLVVTSIRASAILVSSLFFGRGTERTPAGLRTVIWTVVIAKSLGAALAMVGAGSGTTGLFGFAMDDEKTDYRTIVADSAVRNAQAAMLPAGLLLMCLPVGGCATNPAAGRRSGWLVIAGSSVWATVLAAAGIVLLMETVLSLRSIDGLVRIAISGIDRGMAMPVTGNHNPPLWTSAADAYYLHATHAIYAAVAVLVCAIAMLSGRRWSSIPAFAGFLVGVWFSCAEILWLRNHGSADLTQLLMQTAGLPLPKALAATFMAGGVMLYFVTILFSRRFGTCTTEIDGNWFRLLAPWPTPMIVLGAVGLIASFRNSSLLLSRLSSFGAMESELTLQSSSPGILLMTGIMLAGFQQQRHNRQVAHLPAGSWIEVRYWRVSVLVPAWMILLVSFVVFAEAAGQYGLASLVAPGAYQTVADIPGKYFLIFDWLEWPGKIAFGLLIIVIPAKLFWSVGKNCWTMFASIGEARCRALDGPGNENS